MVGLSSVSSGLHHAVEKLFAPEVAAYNWVKGKVFGGAGGAAAEAGAPAIDYHNLGEGEYRFVEYFAQSCPHCTDLVPKWKAAAEAWKQIAADNPKIHLAFEQKQCLDDAWKPGSGHEECGKENVHSFPTLRFFGPEGNMADFDGPRTVDQLVTFAKQHTGIEAMPTPEEAAAAVPAEHVAPAQNQIVEYYAAGCPHCVHLKPVWDDAAGKWAETHPDLKDDVEWVQKECLNDKWQPANDFKDCVREDIQGFPTVRFESKTGEVHEFEGNRTPEDLQKFVAEELQQASKVEVDHKIAGLAGEDAPIAVDHKIAGLAGEDAPIAPEHHDAIASGGDDAHHEKMEGADADEVAAADDDLADDDYFLQDDKMEMGSKLKLGNELEHGDHDAAKLDLAAEGAAGDEQVHDAKVAEIEGVKTADMGFFSLAAAAAMKMAESTGKCEDRGIVMRGTLPAGKLQRAGADFF
mmetsp:Transcript_15590/g.38604  ORF Transcript_15590/g.38604 Transcript_15590/m.38604 type:complete len:464 (-) Transcript_15590:1253-2644(-)|eukprot:g753.t1